MLFLVTTMKISGRKLQQLHAIVTYKSKTKKSLLRHRFFDAAAVAVVVVAAVVVVIYEQ